MSKRKFSSSISGKGYYIALILCAAAIGISGYLYYRNADDPQDNLQKDPQSTVSNNEGVQAVATQPQSQNTQPTVPDATNKPAPQKTLRTAAPVSGSMVAEYAMDCLSYNQTTRDWRVHDGIDLAAEAGTAVCAAADGVVYTVYEDDTMGMTVVIRHDNGYITKYASLAKEVSVAPGDTVQVGQVIGKVGQTALLENAVAPHVHFSVTCDGKTVDPQSFLPQE